MPPARLRGAASARSPSVRATANLPTTRPPPLAPSTGSSNIARRSGHGAESRAATSSPSTISTCPPAPPARPRPRFASRSPRRARWPARLHLDHARPRRRRRGLHQWLRHPLGDAIERGVHTLRRRSRTATDAGRSSAQRGLRRRREPDASAGAVGPQRLGRRARRVRDLTRREATRRVHGRRRDRQSTGRTSRSGPGPKRGTSYLYLGDIGDNVSARDPIIVYRVAGTDQPPRTGAAGRWRAPRRSRCTTPSGPVDAESLFVDPKSGDLFIIDKEYTSGIGKVFRSREGSTRRRRRRHARAGRVVRPLPGR